MKLRAVLVEDEQASRETLRNYIQKYCPDVDLVGEAADVKEGKELILRVLPDLVFLDVEMPYGNAFDLLESVRQVSFETIFVTAFSNYALKALNFSAAYYLLKPIDIEELIAAVEKVKAERGQSDYAMHTRVLIDNMQSASKQLQKVVLPVLEGFEVVAVKDIIRCQANDNFTDFHLTDGTRRVICRTLKFYEEVLSDFDFVRVHKSHLVNLQYIKAYKKGKGGQLNMTDGSVVDVSPARKKELLDRF